jgi:hypothetical protein
MVGSSGEEILPPRRNYAKRLGAVRKVGMKGKDMVYRESCPEKICQENRVAKNLSQ